MNSIIAITCLVLTAILPFWVYSKIMYHFGELDSREVQGKYLVFLEGLRYYDIH
jgi:hypothetical protein